MKQKNLSDVKPWIKSYDKGVPGSIKYPDLMLWEFIQKATNSYPSNLAYEYYGTSVTFSRFMFEIEEVARSLKSIGVKSNDIVTICAPNIPQAIVSFYAVNMIGAVSNMIHPLSGEKEIENYLSISNSKFALVVDIAANKFLNVIDNTSVEKLVVMNIQDKMNSFTKIAYMLTKGRKIRVSYDDETVISWNTFIDFGYMYSGNYVVKKSTNDLAVILYSGGTTGKPKGIKLSNKCFNAATMQTSSMIKPVNPGDSILTIMPIFHAFGLDVCIHTPLSLGVKCILIPTFNYKKFGRLIRQYKPNFIVGVPTLLDTMINDDSLQCMDLSFVKQIITGGDVISSDLKSRVDSFMNEHGSLATVRPGYGLTEGSGASCLLPASKQPVGSIGVPVQDMIYKIVDVNTGEELPSGCEGEILISGPNVMLGYLNDEEETSKVLIKDKSLKVWLKTGDIGKMDEEGFVYFVQRLKRIIISNGYNIYPCHVENVILKSSYVDSVCVVSMPHKYKTSVAKAFIVLNKGEEDTDNIRLEIKKLCEIYLSKYCVPYEFEFRKELPKTLLGKIDYKALEEEERMKFNS